ncbi:hypothetical protein L1987_04223 [Smallanthus sonchifolius]|uniref:Uncharacterized protein n=1 Tax=Smallanthus sonchifolius TaxID=185202 RepID=A0ACB9KD44_9ASTR|nr:hypothetical protein L1987_04223 [Smallanthus sonchifolius]
MTVASVTDGCDGSTATRNSLSEDLQTSLHPLHQVNWNGFVVLDMGGEDEPKVGMWALEQKIDQPMNEETGRLKNMYREKSLTGVAYGIQVLDALRAREAFLVLCCV